MSGPDLQQKTVIDPDLSAVLSILKQDIFASMNCVKVGQVTAFNPSAKTATVQLLFKRVYPDGTIQSYKPLLDCPVFTLQGGGAYLQMPIAAGDQCLVLFSDRRLDEWLQNGVEAAPGDSRTHHMSDAIALVGLNPMNSSLPTYPNNKVVLGYLGNDFQITASGWNIVGSGGAEIDLSASIVTVKNMTTTLLTLMNNFITLLESATVQGPSTTYPFTAAFIALLEAYKAQFATLLG